MFLSIFYFLIFCTTIQGSFVDEECLNYTVYPVQYEITIIPYIFKTGDSYYDCNMVVTIIANAPNVRVIEMDARDLDIRRDSIKVLDGDLDLVNKHRPYEVDKVRGKLYIYLADSLKQYNVYKTQYLLKISFNKRLKKESDGIFTLDYNEDGTTKYLYTTRLSPNKAKYFFPCFDNPRFEAVFKFKVFLPPSRVDMQNSNTSLVISQEQRHYTASNNYQIYEYIPSPQVALYQVGFHHSNFGNRRVVATKTNDTLIVWAPISTLENYNYILQFGESIINLIHEYATINRPLVFGPINLVAVPSILNGYEIGSWNLLTNGDNRLMYMPQLTSIKQMELMKFELAQQLSRIWLGNPGEPERTRWKEEWFKEGVATYLAYYLLAQYNHGEQTLGQSSPIGKYGLEMKHKAMLVDWYHSTPALATFNRTLAIEIPSRYKSLVTTKTASILWMVENWLGSEKFQKALVRYINSRRGKYISLEDFMISLDQDTVECLHQFFNGSTASRVLKSWFHQAGYPVINVQVLRDRNPNVILLKQRQFSFTNLNRVDSNYLIPVSYIMQNNENCFNCHQPRFTIGMQTYSFGENLDGGWIILNRNASGYYRVNYDTYTWRLIAKTLKEDHLAIDELNRAQIVNDVFALFSAGDLDINIAMTVLDYLNEELSDVVWDAAVDGFNLLKIDGANCHMTKTLYQEWQEFMRSKVAALYKRLIDNRDQRPNIRLFRSIVVDFACTLRYEPCLNYMRKIRAPLERQRINPDFRETYYYVFQSESNDNIGSEGLNRCEFEEKINAEHKLREQNRFMYRIPMGTPRPQELVRSTTEFVITTESSTTAQTLVAGPGGSASIISSLLTTILLLLITIIIR
ncbi:PREDICTED: aminopeptidase N-like [Papilio xuthus]|uniref:Aminopeptidase N-like n=1 Tax=Papilio xuthus TaxID=66420 RepID=A0AAJ6ZGI0_PAPXU|nr:PREDICTED: aminopeptidase N-like [Papilio xuthus]